MQLSRFSEQKEAIIQTLYPNNDFQSFTSNYFSVMYFIPRKSDLRNLALASLLLLLTFPVCLLVHVRHSYL